MQLTRTHTHTHTCHLSVECVILYFRCSKFRTTTPRFFLFFPPIFFIFFFSPGSHSSLFFLLASALLFYTCFAPSLSTFAVSAAKVQQEEADRLADFFLYGLLFFCIFSFSNVVNNIQFLQLFLYRKLPAHTRYTHTHTRSLPLFKIPTPTPCLLSCIRIYLYSNVYFVVIWLHIIWFICFQYNFQLVCPSAILFPFFIENFKFVFLVFFFRY